MQTSRWLIAVVLVGCAAAPPRGSSTDGPVNAASDRSAITQAQCEAQHGSVVGDIGDGAIHRPEYVCSNGKPPLGSIAPAAGGPIATEGSVCCPR